MGFFKDEPRERGHTLGGIIIVLGNDLRIRRALSDTQCIEFFKYEVSFKLIRWIYSPESQLGEK